MLPLQLDGELTVEEFFNELDKVSEKLKKKTKNQKINSILSEQINRKWCHFLYRFLQLKRETM